MISDPMVGNWYGIKAFIVLIIYGAVYATAVVFCYVYCIYALWEPGEQLVHPLIQPMVVFRN